ncbi:MAG: hypothetical protein M3530_11620, partial [Thermoproteota archaeon]|nr:hypothetical protein [Thermoproteota archaeon]
IAVNNHNDLSSRIASNISTTDTKMSFDWSKKVVMDCLSFTLYFTKNGYSLQNFNHYQLLLTYRPQAISIRS